MTKHNKWNFWTSWHLFEYCVFSWQGYMWMHIDGFDDEERMRELFWHYLNYGKTHYDTYNG